MFITIDGIDESYKVIGLLTNLTDSQKEAVCEYYDSFFVGKCFKDYKKDCFPIYFKVDESFASLLESKGIEDLGNWILLTANK